PRLPSRCPIPWTPPRFRRVGSPPVRPSFPLDFLSDYGKEGEFSNRILSPRKRKGIFMGGALQGIRVIEIASYVTGPLAGLLLADMGADVVKLEQPGQGDPFRGWGENLYSSNFRSLNRNKKSLTLDIRKDDAREIFLKLASGADVLIENFRPGTL